MATFGCHFWAHVFADCLNLIVFNKEAKSCTQTWTQKWYPKVAPKMVPQNQTKSDPGTTVQFTHQQCIMIAGRQQDDNISKNVYKTTQPSLATSQAALLPEIEASPCPHQTASPIFEPTTGSSSSALVHTLQHHLPQRSGSQELT